MVDHELKLKLAKAARELADEVEAGKGPELGFGSTFYDDGTPCCAMGHVYTKAGISKEDRFDMAHRADTEDLLNVAYPVENANDALMPKFQAANIRAEPLPKALREYALAVEGL